MRQHIQKMARRFFQLHLENQTSRRTDCDRIRIRILSLSILGSAFYHVKEKGVLALIVRIDDSEPGVAKIDGGYGVSVAIPGTIAEIKGVLCCIL